MIRSFFDRLPTTVRFGAGRGVALVIQLAATAVLMNQLGPEVFGLVGMTTALIALLTTVSDSGFGTSLVSDQGFSRGRSGSAVALSIGLGAILAVVGLALTPVVVWFYGESRLQTIWIVFALTIALSPLPAVPQSLAQRAHRFALLAWVPVVVTVVSSLAAIAVAFFRQDYWPLLVRTALGSVVATTLIWTAIRPRLERPTREDFQEILGFSRGLIGFDLLNAVNRNADHVIVGRFVGSGALGLYQLAHRVLTLPLAELGRIARTIAYPRLAGYAPDWARVAHGLAGVMRDLTMFATPLCLGIFVAAPELIAVVFGDPWLPSLVPFRILVLVGIHQTPFSMMGLAYTVSRRTDRMALWGMISTPVTVASFFLGLPWGITGVAVAYLLANIVLAWPMAAMGGSVLGVGPMVFLRAFGNGLALGALATAPLVAVCWGLRWLEAAPWIVLFGSMAAGGLGELLVLGHLIRRGSALGAA